MDTVSRETSEFRDVALALDVGFWVMELPSMRVYWPRGLGLAEVETRYGWTSLQAVSSFYPDGERQRFRTFVECLVRAPGETQIVLLKAFGPHRSLIPFRLAGRLVRNEDGACIYGILEAVREGQPAAREKANDIAGSLSRVLDSLMLAAQTAAVFFDSDLRIWRASPMGLRVLGLAGETLERLTPSRIKSALPSDVQQGLMDAIRQCAGSSGTHAIGNHAGYNWRIQVWHEEGHAAGGAVLVMTPVVRDEVGHRGGQSTGQKFLEGLRAPLLVVSAATAEVDFANSSARSLLHLKPGERYFVKNLVEVCGHVVPSTAFEEVRRGANFVNLRSGARVVRADAGGEELLIEYMH